MLKIDVSNINLEDKLDLLLVAVEAQRQCSERGLSAISVETVLVNSRYLTNLLEIELDLHDFFIRYGLSKKIDGRTTEIVNPTISLEEWQSLALELTTSLSPVKIHKKSTYSVPMYPPTGE
jgi:hypothetical protein